MVLLLLRRPVLVAVSALGALVVCVAPGSATTTSLPSLYVSYNSQCHFTMALDSGAAVAAGSTIPYGEYQLIISTPVPFASGLGGCNFINFSLTGPGVNYTTDLGEGDETEDFTTQNFAAVSNYVATDSTVAPGTTISFGTSSTRVSASSGPSSSSSTTPNSKATSDDPTKAKSNPVVNRGTLKGTVSVSGNVSLTFDGKPVTEITAGRYKVQVVDKSHHDGFTIQQTTRLPTTVTGISFVGTRSATIVLAAGQSLFYPSFASKKSYFFVRAAP